MSVWNHSDLDLSDQRSSDPDCKRHTAEVTDKTQLCPGTPIPDDTPIFVAGRKPGASPCRSAVQVQGIFETLAIPQVP